MKYLIFILSFILTDAFSQQSNNKLDALLNLCDQLKNEGKYKDLILTSNKGEKIAKNSDYHYTRFLFYKAYGYEYDNNQYEKAIPLFEKSWRLANKNKFLKEETLAIMRLNYLYYSTKKFKKRDSLIKYINNVLDTTKNIHTQGILNGSLGEYYLDKAEIAKFIGYKLKAIEYRKKFPKDDTKNFVNIGISYAQIGQAYYKMKHYSKGIEFFNLAKPYLTKSNNALAFLYNDYIKCYTQLKKLDSLQLYYNNIHKLITKEDSLHISVSSANRYLAEYYISENKISNASKYAYLALVYATKSNDEEIVMEAKISNGKLLIINNKFNEAIILLKEASLHAYEFDKVSFITINKLLSECYKKLGNYQLALHFHEIYSKANEELLNESAKQSIANAEAQFQNKHKQEKIEFLSAENKIKNLEIESSRKQVFYLVIGAFLLLTIAGLLYKQNINRKRTNKKLITLNNELDKANKTKARFFSIINHDLRSPVANLIHFLHLKKENPELLDEVTAQRLELQTIQGAENLLSSMEDLLLWSKSQMEHFEPVFKLISISTIFDDIKKNYSQFEGFQFDNKENLFLKTDENYLKTITRNLTSNALKVLENQNNPLIRWEAKKTGDIIQIIITDNGPGISEGKFKALFDENEVIGIKSGLGLHLIRDFTKAIGCTLNIDSSHQGTSITLTF